MTDTILEIHGKKVLLLDKAITTKKIPNPESVDLWIINNPNGKLVRKFLTSVLRSKDLRIYLKPIFLQREFKKGYGNNADVLKHLSDGYIKEMNFIDKVSLVDLINGFINKTHKENNYLGMNSDEFYTKKILYYYYSRSRNIIPIINRDSLTGYFYPRIEVFFENKTEAYVRSRRLLREAFLNGLLIRTYIDTSHLCKSCNSGFLNYREVCPKCSDHNLRARDLIHHFRCAYVGTEKDFLIKDLHVCPKCSSELKNLGVDYDKPGKIFICKNKKCNHEFQEAPVGVYCIDCKTEQFPEELIVKKIYSYELTNLGYEQVLQQ